MSKEIEIVILTKSSKNNGYCVAGIDVNDNKWVRLISSDTESHGALFNNNIQYQDKTFCDILDVVRVPILKEDPNKHQPENILINSEKCWEKINKFKLSDVFKIHPIETHQYLLGNADYYLTAGQINTIGHSLILVKVSNLIINHPRDKTTKANFIYNSTQYENISVTDQNLYSVENGKKFSDAILVMSLPAVPFNQKYFKFIAKIFPIKIISQ